MPSAVSLQRAFSWNLSHDITVSAGLCNHGDGVVMALIVLFSPVPITLLLMGLIFFCSHTINERESLQLQEQKTTVHAEATSAAADQETVDQSKTGVISGLNCNTNTKLLHRASKYSKHSLKSSVLLNVSKSLSGEHSSGESVVQSNENPECHEQRQSPKQRLGETK
ncbi:hypothetical protein Q5P01_008029 [Channa striata]|uniref:Uncharacterized protein n=1 Tax=Channa striata TaxID=64152 RepID=A0AA88N7S3_CHASR|nr:hypothetical protein Q5P01_008029 [Channa striata]